MSSVLSLPSSSPSSSATVGDAITLASRIWRFFTVLFTAEPVDTSDVWRLYHVARETDSVSVAAVDALADRLKAE